MVPTVLVCDPSATRALPAGAPAPMRPVKLGRRKPVARPLVPRLSAYFQGFSAATPPPASVDYSAKAKAAIAQVYGNDQAGDCVIAGKTHAVGVWSGNDTGTPVIGSTSEALSEYHRLCGPGDNGCVITDVLDAMKSGGLSVGGQRRTIDGYVALNPADPDQVKVALIVFGGFTIGFNVPNSWMGRNAYDGAVWDDPGFFIPVGGHDMRAVGYNATGVQFATWGFVVTMTWKALADSRIVDEAYVELSPEWYGSDKLAPSGIDADGLRADLAKIGSGDLPDWQPPAPEPTPTPNPTPNPTPTPVPVPSGGFTITLQGTAVPVSLPAPAPVPVPVSPESGSITEELLDLLRAVLEAVFSHPQVREALGAKGAIPWAAVILLAVPLIPVVIADLQAKKPIGQVVADVVQALLAEIGGNPKPVPAPAAVAAPVPPPFAQ